MLTGICPYCEYQCFGWALLNPQHQSCPKCGTALEIKTADGLVSDSCSAFPDDKYLFLNLPYDVFRLIDTEEDGFTPA